MTNNLAIRILRGEVLGTNEQTHEAVFMAIKALKAEPVIKCKDCKFNYANQIPSDDVCQLCVELPISKDFFCAYGAKMDEVNDDK